MIVAFLYSLSIGPCAIVQIIDLGHVLLKHVEMSLVASCTAELAKLFTWLMLSCLLFHNHIGQF